MKHTTIMLAVLLGLTITSGATADESKTLEQRVSNLENTMPKLPNGLFINGEIEMYIDEDAYTSKIDSRAEIITGLQSDVEAGPIDWAGGSARFDSHYS